MRNTVLVDSGPLIALFDKDDKFHTKVLNYLKDNDVKLLTSLAVITEVSHILDFNLKVQIDFLKWVELGGVVLYDIKREDLKDIVKLMQKYTNVPMDFADATLIYISFQKNIRQILSIDSDFDIYRSIKNGFLENVLR